MELSNAATVLIARMKSHPKDFEMGERFGYLQDSLMQLIGVGNASPYGGMGRLAYLSDADREALAGAWRELNYTKFEKEIMEATFKSDAEYEEEKKKMAYPMGIQGMNAQAQRVAMQNAMLGQNQLHPAQNASSQAGSGLFGFGSLGAALGISK